MRSKRRDEPDDDDDRALHRRAETLEEILRKLGLGQAGPATPARILSDQALKALLDEDSWLKDLLEGSVFDAEEKILSASNGLKLINPGDEIVESIYNSLMRRELTSSTVALLAVILGVRDERRLALKQLVENFADAGDAVSHGDGLVSSETTPRPKWGSDREPGEDPAHFAARAYETEMAAGTLHRGIIRREDPELHRRLNSWLRSHPMPEGVDIPTLPVWNTRELEKRGGPPPSGRRTVRTPEGRFYDALRYRTAKPR